jgi:hypothetical protein
MQSILNLIKQVHAGFGLLQFRVLSFSACYIGMGELLNLSKGQPSCIDIALAI